MRALIPFILLLVACATVPYTNRKQLNFLSAKEEIELGTQAYREVLRSNPRSNNKKWIQQLTSVGGSIQRQARARSFRWEFAVLKGKEVNAFALPGGKVAFWEGIMPVCDGDAGVAVVMGHEVAHAIAHHGAERVSQSLGLGIVGELLSVGLSDGDPQKKDQLMTLYGLGVQVGVMLPWGRSQESEADRIGLILMAKAGYNPREAPRFWRRMSKKEGAGVPEFLSTHPSHNTRIANLNKWMSQARRYYKKKR
jgi:predicted Zn-dependent protease